MWFIDSKASSSESCEIESGILCRCCKNLEFASLTLIKVLSTTGQALSISTGKTSNKRGKYKQKLFSPVRGKVLFLVI